MTIRRIALTLSVIAAMVCVMTGCGTGHHAGSRTRSVQDDSDAVVRAPTMPVPPSSVVSVPPPPNPKLPVSAGSGPMQAKHGLRLPTGTLPIPQSAGVTAIQFVKVLCDVKSPAAKRVHELVPLSVQGLFASKQPFTGSAGVSAQRSANRPTGLAVLYFVAQSEPSILLYVPTSGPDKGFVIGMQSVDTKTWKVSSFGTQTAWTKANPSTSPPVKEMGR